MAAKSGAGEFRLVNAWLPIYHGLMIKYFHFHKNIMVMSIAVFVVVCAIFLFSRSGSPQEEVLYQEGLLYIDFHFSLLEHRCIIFDEEKVFFNEIIGENPESHYPFHSMVDGLYIQDFEGKLSIFFIKDLDVYTVEFELSDLVGVSLYFQKWSDERLMYLNTDTSYDLGFGEWLDYGRQAKHFRFSGVDSTD